MDWTSTFILLGCAAALLAFSVWQSMRPRKDTLRARWISWRFMILVAGAAVFLCLVHMANLLGINTGQQGPRL
jgi:hypothetical protein